MPTPTPELPALDLRCRDAEWIDRPETLAEFAAPAPVRRRVLTLLEKAGYQLQSDNPAVLLIDLPRITAGGKASATLEILSGLQPGLLAEGVGLQMEFLPGDQNLLTEYVEGVCKRHPSALVVPTDAPWRSLAGRMAARAGVPFFQIGYDNEDPRYPAAVVDSFAGAYQAATFLLHKGHRRVASVRWIAAGIPNANKKHAGYQAALADAGIPLDEQLVVAVPALQGEPGWRCSRDLVEALLDLPDPPTALFVENSFLSPPLLYPGPADAGKLPAGLAEMDMVHFEDWPLEPVQDLLAGKLGFAFRPTTVVRIDWDAIGLTAARLLAQNIRNGGTDPHPIVRVSPILETVSATGRATSFAPPTGDTK